MLRPVFVVSWPGDTPFFTLSWSEWDCKKPNSWSWYCVSNKSEVCRLQSAFPLHLFHQTHSYLPRVNASSSVLLNTVSHLSFDSRRFARVSITNHTFINHFPLLIPASRLVCRLRPSADRPTAFKDRRKQWEMGQPNNCGRLLWMAGQMSLLREVNGSGGYW